MSARVTTRWSRMSRGRTLLMVMLASVVLGTIGFSRSPALLRLMGVAPDVYPARWASCACRSSASSSISPSSSSRRSCAASASRPLPVYIVLGTVFLNFVLDPLLIFGWGPVPALWRDGRGRRPLITQAIAAVIGIAILRLGLPASMCGGAISFPTFPTQTRFLPRPPRLRRAVGAGTRPDGDDLPGRQLRHADAGGLRRRLQHPAGRHGAGDGRCRWRSRPWSARTSAPAASSARANIGRLRRRC